MGVLFSTTTQWLDSKWGMALCSSSQVFSCLCFLVCAHIPISLCLCVYVCTLCKYELSDYILTVFLAYGAMVLWKLWTMECHGVFSVSWFWAPNLKLILGQSNEASVFFFFFWFPFETFVSFSDISTFFLKFHHCLISNIDDSFGFSWVSISFYHIEMPAVCLFFFLFISTLFLSGLLANAVCKYSFS